MLYRTSDMYQSYEYVSQTGIELALKIFYASTISQTKKSIQLITFY